MISEMLISASRFAIIHPNSGATVSPFEWWVGKSLSMMIFIERLDVHEALLESRMKLPIYIFV